MLGIVEIDADERIVARVVFDLDDIEAAFAELDARYLAGEAAAHAHTWSVIAEALRRAQSARMPATTPDLVNIDHRRVANDRCGRHERLLRAAWEVTPDVIELHRGVHRLSDLGAVVTQWRMGPHKRASTPSGG